MWADKRFYALAALPALFVITVVVAVPLLIGIYLSFTNYTPILPTFAWAGLTNYVNIIHNAQIHVVINNTIIYAGAGIVIQMVARVGRGPVAGQADASYGDLPCDLHDAPDGAGRCVAVTWSVLFNTSNGWVNYFFSLVGLPQLNWAGGSHTAMPTVLIASAWTGIPIVGIILLAGLLTLPKEPFEAATIDGASPGASPLAYHVAGTAPRNRLRHLVPTGEPVPRVRQRSRSLRAAARASRRTCSISMSTKQHLYSGNSAWAPPWPSCSWS